MTRWIVNGRFLRSRPTGLHRTARSLLSASLAGGLDAEVLAPRGTRDPLVSRTVSAPSGRVGDHVWEQVVLPVVARGAPILSLANTAPVASSRSVVFVHDLAPLVGPEWFATSMRIYGRMVLRGARRAVAVATVSQVVADELADHGVERERIAVIPPAVDDRFAPADDEAQQRARRRVGVEGPFVLFVGWADPRKDLAAAVAAHRIARQEEDHRLVAIGAAHPAFASVDPPPDDSVVVAGYVPEEDLAALYTAADALVYPSRYEGFGLPPLEAAACGTPAIVADVPVLRESTRGAATFVPPGDPDALADRLVAAVRGELAAPAPPDWTWDDAAERLLALLGEVA